MKTIEIRLKSLDEILVLSVPVIMMYDGINKICLKCSDAIQHPRNLGLYHADYFQELHDRSITVVDKADYEFADAYCYYHPDGYKLKIGDWMVADINERVGDNNGIPA